MAGVRSLPDALLNAATHCHTRPDFDPDGPASDSCQPVTKPASGFSDFMDMRKKRGADLSGRPALECISLDWRTPPARGRSYLNEIAHTPEMVSNCPPCASTDRDPGQSFQLPVSPDDGRTAPAAATWSHAPVASPSAAITASTVSRSGPCTTVTLFPSCRRRTASPSPSPTSERPAAPSFPNTPPNRR